VLVGCYCLRMGCSLCGYTEKLWNCGCQGGGEIVKRPKKRALLLFLGDGSFIYGYGKDCTMEMGKQGALDESSISSRFGLLSLELERDGDAMGCFFRFEWGKQSS